MFIEKIAEPETLSSGEIARRLLSPDAAIVSGKATTPQPSLKTMRKILNRLSDILLAGGDEDPHAHERLALRLDRLRRALAEQIGCAYALAGEENRTEHVVALLFAALPALREALAADLQAAYEGDPAASSPLEVLACYPGIRAIAAHRLAHELHLLGVPLVPRMLAEISHGETGIDIHPGARIGRSFFIDHGTGVVIGATSIIGERVRIYQGVTLGARSFPAHEDGTLVKGLPRHPIVEDDVVIYGGACILGRVTIGAGSVIGGNVWLTRSVPPGSRIVQAAERSRQFANGEGI